MLWRELVCVPVISRNMSGNDQPWLSAHLTKFAGTTCSSPKRGPAVGSVSPMHRFTGLCRGYISCGGMRENATPLVAPFGRCGFSTLGSTFNDSATASKTDTVGTERQYTHSGVGSSSSNNSHLPTRHVRRRWVPSHPFSTLVSVLLRRLRRRWSQRPPSCWPKSRAVWQALASALCRRGHS
jgi:hypothetical protein